MTTPAEDGRMDAGELLASACEDGTGVSEVAPCAVEVALEESATLLLGVAGGAGGAALPSSALTQFVFAVNAAGQET